VLLPGESHGYVARESILHVLAESFDWFDRHVKNAEPKGQRINADLTRIAKPDAAAKPGDPAKPDVPKPDPTAKPDPDPPKRDTPPKRDDSAVTVEPRKDATEAPEPAKPEAAKPEAAKPEPTPPPA
jgi:hypothetical protein